MTDISKCHGENCPVRDICYRFTAKADPHWQSYMEPDRNGSECKSFWSRQAQPVRTGPDQCLPVPGESLGSFECAHCGRDITTESDPEAKCAKPYRRTKAHEEFLKSITPKGQ